QKELAPIVEEDDRNERFRPELIAKLGELGLTGVPVPESLGGAGLGYQEYAVVIEELAAVSAGYAVSLAVTGLPQVILSTFGTEEQKKKHIPPLAAGKAIGAFALSEASSGSDAGSLRAAARKDGDHYVLNGTKLWCTQADSADLIVVMARTGGPGPSGVSAFLVEKDTPGISFGKREKKMAMHVSHTMELLLQDVRIPAANRVGGEGDGFKVALTALNGGRITIGATAVGVARAAFEIAVRHSNEREQFGHPIIELQGVSFLLADSAVALDASRLLVKRAAWLKDNGRAFATEASMAKLFATDAAMQITTDAVQILGGSGYTQDFPVERFMREAKVLQIVEGTNQIQRVVIGRALASPRK
ncbi:MAG TPA: acyl-CoA dehydrogenase family protein, partial [Bdellovibrionota bacterium]|nr:acyl-CoA dehydrogenase family protein [Bdellovibrionota bacterium]